MSTVSESIFSEIPTTWHMSIFSFASFTRLTQKVDAGTHYGKETINQHQQSKKQTKNKEDSKL